MGIARDWDQLVQSPSWHAPGEAHELGLIIFGIQLARLGWRVTYLGADTPVATLLETVKASAPAIVVLGVTDFSRARHHAAEYRSIAAEVPLAVGGSISSSDGRLLDARVLEGDPLDAARSVAVQR